MKKLFSLLRPHLFLFVLGVVWLLLSAAFASAMTGLISPLMSNVLTDTASTAESRTEEIFGYEEKIERINEVLKKIGIQLPEPKMTLNGPLMSPVSWGLLVFLFFCFQALFEYMGTYTMARIGLNVVVGLRQSIIDKVMSQSMTFFKRYDTGEIISRVSTDVLRIQNAISIRMGVFIRESAKSLMFLILLFVWDWKLSLTLFVLIPLIGIPITIMTRKIRKNAIKSQSFLAYLTSHLKEVLVGIRIVKGFQKEAYESERLAAENRSFLKYALREVRIVTVTTPIMSVIGIVIILAFVWYGATMIQTGEMEKGDLIAYVLFVYSMYQPIKRLAKSNTEIQQAVGVLPRIEEILEIQNELEEAANPVRFEGYPKIGSIHFDNACFAYEKSGTDPVLKDINLEVKAGQIVALVGQSGSGKSTMVNLIPRFYDVGSGAVRFNNVDIRQMSKTDLRALVGLVTQDTILFNDTVHNNIAYGLPDMSREKVIDAAHQAFAHNFIERLPLGYETVIGESGGKLSGGQRQRLSIARAILKGAPVLILDEATSALDTESEREVQLALENLMESKTTIVIAHRLSTIRRADLIVVLNEGEIVERGTHQSLMSEDGTYHKLVRMQEEGIDAL